jgi:oxygen-dependent protoporphyrinogen oxidase
MTHPQVLIIGAGISGLSTAWWLAQEGIAVEIWEAGASPGGKIQTTRESGYLTERAAGLIVNYRPEIDRLITQSGLSASKRTRPDNLNRYVVHNDQLTAVPMQIAGLVRSPLWSWQAKLRLLLEGFIPRGHQSDESASQFICRRLGKEILETAFDPFIAGTLASDPELAEARSVLPRLTAIEQRYGSITLGVLINSLIKKKPRRANHADTFSFQGGMSDLITQLSLTPGVNIRYGMRVEDIAPVGQEWRIHAASNRGTHTRQVAQLVITTPADTTASLLADFDRPLSRLLSDISYAPVSIAHIGFDDRHVHHPLDGTGFLVPRKARLCFNGNLWMSRLFPDRAPEGKTLLTSYLGGARHAEIVAWSDDRIVNELLSQLSPLLGLQGEAAYIRIDRHIQGLPLYHGQHQARIEAIRTCLRQHTGLHLTANYLEGISVRECIFQGSKTAAFIRRSLPHSAHESVTSSSISYTQQHPVCL